MKTISAKNSGAGEHVSILEFFSPSFLGTLLPPPGTSIYSTETYKSEQVSKIFKQKFN